MSIPLTKNKPMKIIFAIIVVCLCFNLSVSQEANAVQIVDLVHGKKIEARVQSMKAFVQDSIKLEQSIKALTEKLSVTYAKQYNSQDIKALITFYKSTTGKKFLKSQEELNSDVSHEIFKWESELQGIDSMEDEANVVFTEPLLEKEAESLETYKNQEHHTEKAVVKVLPKVNTINDLKKLITNDSMLLFDPQRLAKLLEVEALLNPTLENEVVFPTTEKNNKN